MQARQMFEGEVVSLEALRSTGLVRAPRPMKIIDLPGGGAAFVMEHLKMRSLSSQASKLGDQMADLHLYNQKLREKLKVKENTVGQRSEGAEPQYVTKFGFHTVTCCGFIPQVNEWQDDWPTFFARHRLQAQLDLIEKDYADREARELWSRLQVKIPDLFCGLEIVPALLHGDLWSGNVAEDDAGPIIYDPASFYGHSEFELAIALMFGGFPRSFFTAYHRKIPKAPGFDQRLLLYQLFNYLNHWNHFGREYRSPSLGTMRRLLNPSFPAPAPFPRPCPLSQPPLPPPPPLPPFPAPLSPPLPPSSCPSFPHPFALSVPRFASSGSCPPFPAPLFPAPFPCPCSPIRYLQPLPTCPAPVPVPLPSASCRLEDAGEQ
ncbi:Fructosamine-3-kinase [Plecturocebus cupreus]